MEKRKFKHPVNQKSMFGEQSFFVYDAFIVNVIQAHVKQVSLNIMSFFQKRKYKCKLQVKVYLCLLALSCLSLCDPMDCSLPGSSVHGDSPGKNTGGGCRALLQGIFPTQVWNPGLLHCRQILYHLSHHLFRS